TVTPETETAPLIDTAHESTPAHPHSSPIASYTFDFGDGTVVGPQATATATHTYTTAGTFTVKVTVTDTAANSSTATGTVTVAREIGRASRRERPQTGAAPLAATANAA